MSFENFKLNRQLLNAIADLGFTEPTEIQQKAIPQISGGHDILGIAQTGTGKTAAYLLPILMKIKYAQGTNPRVLILTPTRELAMQVDEQVGQLAKYCDLRHTAIYGGLGPKTQIETIAKGIDILVATPGRLMDIYLKGDLILKDIKVLVLDEADKMMDMGFMPQIRKVLEVVPNKRQNLLFSATMPDKVGKLADEFLLYPMRIEVTAQSTPVDTVSQVLYEVPNFLTKINLLQHFIRDKGEEFKRVIVFVRTKQHADNVYKFLHRKVTKDVKVIHANKGQNTRINSIDEFKEGNIRVLVATDVAARGLDVSLVSHVINFDVPIIYEDYVHRIGRTGRAKNTGIAITFANKAELYHIDKIEEIIRMKIPLEPLPAGVKIEEAEFEESQAILKELDTLKKIDDPTFKGAFHEKKEKNLPRDDKRRWQKRGPGKRRR
ncbi:MAG: DEAD/DEAH box helicase [Cytophagaceae bacterium]